MKKLQLPAFSLFDHAADARPHRLHEEASCRLRPAKLDVEIIFASNWPRTRWFVFARYVEKGHFMRPCNSLTTTSVKRAVTWRTAIEAGEVEIAEREA